MTVIQNTNRLICFLVLMSGFSAYAQHKTQLRISDSVHRVGYINQMEMRSGFRDLKTYRMEKRTAFLALASKHKEEKRQDSLNMARSIKTDSLTGGKQKKLLAQSWQQKNETLNINYDKDQRANHKQTVEGMRQLELRMQIAIQQVVTEMGLTDVKSFDKEGIPKSGVDITNLVLAKLNK